MGVGGDLPGEDVSGLVDLLQTSLGIDDAARLVGSLSALSARLWTPPQDGLREQHPETFRSIAPESEATAVLRLLAAHAGRVDPWPADRLAAQDFEPVYGWRWEATAVLVTGALAFGAGGGGRSLTRTGHLTRPTTGYGSTTPTAACRRGRCPARRPCPAGT